MTEFHNDAGSTDDPFGALAEADAEQPRSDDGLPALDVEDEVYGVSAEEKYNEAAEELADAAWAEASAEVAEELAAETGQAQPDAAEEELDPVEQLRNELRRAPGDWFVVHSYAGYENKVKTNLETRITSLDMEEFIYQVEVPTREEVEVKNGKRTQVQNKVFPGYILVRMELSPESYSCVRNTPGVTGFVGATDRADRPSPLSLD